MSLQVLQGDCREVLASLPAESVQCCVTSPPYYGLRDYGHPGQIGQESTPDLYVETMRAVFAEVRRILRKDGTLWLNLGDSYNSGPSGGLGGSTLTGGQRNQAHSNRASRKMIAAAYRDLQSVDSFSTRLGTAPAAAVGSIAANKSSIKPKDLIGIPWRVALALQADGWYLRSDIIWAKRNCMPESVTDRPTRSHEYIFLLSKSERYYYDFEAIKEPCVFDIEKRIGQPNFENQTGGEKDPKNGNRSHRKVLENIKRKADKQRGHSRRHDGFNDRWDQMEKAEQCTGMRNKRDVWTIAPANYEGAHFATYPPDLVKPCILAGTKPGDTVLDPFGGSGTTGQVALELGRSAILIELNPAYIPLIEQRTNVTKGLALA